MDEFNPEGIEGDVIDTSPYLPDNEYRCTNKICPINTECRRYLQYKIEINLKLNTLKTEFFQPISDLKDFNYKEDGCPKFLIHES